jgi:hypothetical protein
MPAVVTDELKRQIATDFFEQFTSDTKKYYIGIGRSEQWDASDTVPTPVNTPIEISNLRDGLQSVKKVTGTSLVVPRNNWSSGAIYSQYDDQQGGYPTNPYYVMTENNQVYVCLETGRNNLGVAQPSSIEPTGSNNDSFRTSDGYVWKFLFTVSAERGNDFMSANFMPVKVQTATDSNSTGIQLKQKEVQDTAVAGQVLSVIITEAGAGYTTAPTITINGTGSGALATGTVDTATGTVSRIRMNDSGASQILGSGYTSATVTITGGGSPTLNATARAVLGPDSGIGRDSREDLKSTSIMFHSELLGSDSDFIIDQDFRQVGLIRDPLTPAGTVFNSTTGNCLYAMRMSSTITSFTADKEIKGATSNAKAYIDEVDSDLLYYHQTTATGFGTFVTGELIEETDGAGEGVVDSAAILPEVDPESGAILFIDNRAPVIRATAQNEDIKVIIQF